MHQTYIIQKVGEAKMNKDMLLGEALSLLKVYRDGVTSYYLNEAARTLINKIEENYSEEDGPVSSTTGDYPPPCVTPWQSNG